MILRYFFIFLTFIYLVNCSGNSDKNELSSQDEFNPPKIQYTQAMLMFDNQQYEIATDKFKNIERIYPLSNEAIQSQIMQGFINYILLDYDLAIIHFSRIINKYPSLKNIDYVYYMKALCYYEQISHEGLDGKFNELALENLDQVIQRFPNSKYAKDSFQKKILVKSNIAAKHMTIARYYQKEKKYTAALNRYKIVIKSFEETKFVPEALYRVSEIYLSIGMKEESKKNASILGYNYPESKWYKFIYNDLTSQNNETIFSKSIGKIFN
ncbi:outer membrane protein assembly factor BamD [Alphaproteobacteria bacterium]|nr:outer membrane protein assembly factor BamD [Alphaproteobacteria bacterium]